MKRLIHIIIILLTLLPTACHYADSDSKSLDVKADTSTLNQYRDSANALYDNGQWGASLDFAKQAASIAEQLHDTIALTDAMSFLLADYQQLGMPDSAIIVAKQLLEIDKKMGDPSDLSNDYNSIAFIYTAAKNYPLAIEFIEKAIEMEKKVDGQPHLSIRYGIAAEAYNQLANDSTRTDVMALRQKALDYITMAYDLDNAHKDTLRAARRLSVKGDILLGMNRASDTEQAYLQAIAALEHLGERHSLAITYRQLGALYLSQHKNAEAIPLLEKSTAITRKAGELSALVKDYQQLHLAYQTIDDKKSNEYLKLYTQTKDSVYTLETARSLSEFQVRYDTEKAQEEADQKQRQLIVSYVFAFIIICVIVLVLIRVVVILRRRNRHNALLREQIKLLKGQMEEMQRQFLEQRQQEEADEAPEMPEQDKSFLASVDDAIFKIMGSDDLSAEKIASELCITSQQLRRKIKAIKDVTTIAYINSIRTDYAKRLLTGRPDLSIVQVGQLCGFFEPTHFSRFFKKETGMTPTRFRDQ